MRMCLGSLTVGTPGLRLCCRMNLSSLVLSSSSGHSELIWGRNSLEQSWKGKYPESQVQLCPTLISIVPLPKILDVEKTRMETGLQISPAEPEHISSVTWIPQGRRQGVSLLLVNRRSQHVNSLMF